MPKLLTLMILLFVAQVSRADTVIIEADEVLSSQSEQWEFSFQEVQDKMLERSELNCFVGDVDCANIYLELSEDIQDTLAQLMHEWRKLRYDINTIINYIEQNPISMPTSEDYKLIESIRFLISARDSRLEQPNQAFLKHFIASQRIELDIQKQDYLVTADLKSLSLQNKANAKKLKYTMKHIIHSEKDSVSALPLHRI